MNKVTPETITQAVKELKEAHRFLCVDGLDWTVGEIGGDHTVEEVIAEALKHPEQIEVSIKYLSMCSRTKGRRVWPDTYCLKHEVESFPGRWVSHTSFLVACQLDGWSIVSSPERSWAGRLCIGVKRPCAIVGGG